MHEHAVSYLWLIPILPLLGAIVNGILAIGWGHREQGPPRPLVNLIACLAPAGSFVVTAVGFFALRGLPPMERALTQKLFTWIEVGALKIDLGFLLDPLSAAMLLFVTGIGFLIHVYSVGYMAHDRGFARYFSYLNLFMFAMILLVLGDSLPVLFIGWEGVGLCSYLLIGFWHEDPDKAAAGMKAFIVNRIGDFGFLIGMFLIFWALVQGGEPTLSFAGMRAQAGLFTPALATAAGILLFVGATGKSAQIPLYVWLPDAMAGPTPVSALIHAATMVTAGVYMVARMNFLYVLSPVALTVVAVVGVLTAVMAATIGLTQFDIKKVLAYSTVSQLGYMFLGVGVGAFSAGVFHVVTHAFFKALLFLGAGSVIHALSGEQDIRKMGGIFKKVPYTGWTFLAAWLAICGIFPFAGFFSKDEILWKAFSTHNMVLPWLPQALWVVGFLAAGVTALYMTRLVIMTFFGKSRVEPKAAHHIHESPPSMTLPLVVLAVGAVVVGFLGTPPILGMGANKFEAWLEPVFAAGPQPGHEMQASASHSATGYEALEGGYAAGEDAGHGAAEDGHAGSDAGHGAGVAGKETAAAGHSTAQAGHAAAHGAGDAHGHHNVALEWGLMIASMALALIGILLGWLFYLKNPQVPERVARSMGGIYRLVRDKYRVDEAYEGMVIRPLVWSSRRVLFGVVDVKIIDAIVNGVGLTARLGSYMFRFMQTGYVRAYAFIILAGLVIFLLAGR